MNEHLSNLTIAFRGTIGTLAPILGVVSSFQENLEWVFRMASLTVGIMVGVVTIWSLIKKKP